MNQPTHIIVHESASPWGCAREVRKWHIQRGFSDVGYHFVILNGRILPDLYLVSLDGAIEAGRSTEEDGAHCIGYNDKSIGICLIGEKKNGEATFTSEQLYSLRSLCLELCHKYKIKAENVLGHRETESGKQEGKTCPDFDVQDIRTYLKGRV